MLHTQGDPGSVGALRTQADESRIVVDPQGMEWEIYDESQWSVSMALDWDYLPQTENPGLIFVSRNDRRRMWPAPAEWKKLTNEQLLVLCANATSIL